MSRERRRCSAAAHQTLKHGPLWSTLLGRGIQKGEPDLELRECPDCGSTLAREVDSDTPAAVGITPMQMHSPEGIPVVSIGRVEVGTRVIPGDGIASVQINVVGPHVIGWRLLLKDRSYIDIGIGAPIVIYYNAPSGLVAPL
jgi:hypothetical protein